MRLKNRVFFLVLALSVAVGLLVPAQPARAYTSVSVSFFYDSLAPYGSWVTVGSYGRCWRPAHVSAGWQPYLYGKWIYTDAGWTWVSFDPWGGDPYHYGTWVSTAGYGWIWVPGTIWAPAWVTWYMTDDAFGWAPVPPSFYVGISGYVGPAVTVSRSAYVFVPAQQFAGVNVSSVRVPATQNATFISRARPVTHFAVQGGVLSSGGPAISQVERVAGRRIQRVSITSAKTQPVPIRTSLHGGRAPVVVPASERAKQIAAHEKARAAAGVPLEDGGRDVRPRGSYAAAASCEAREGDGPSAPSAPRARETRKGDCPPAPAAAPGESEAASKRSVRSRRHLRTKSTSVRTAHQPPPPPVHERPEKVGTQAQLNSAPTPPPARGEKPAQHVQPKPQGPPPAPTRTRRARRKRKSTARRTRPVEAACKSPSGQSGHWLSSTWSNLRSAGRWLKIAATMATPEDREPFDETAVTRGRHRCYFCESEKSDEWKFLAKLNAFVCKACQERIEKKLPDERKTG